MSKCKVTDLWRTPKQVFNALNREFEFVADMAASEENCLIPLHYSESDDSLSFDWAEEINAIFPSVRNWVWCNPPYSNPKPWVKKAIESQHNGLGVVLLLNADDSTEWFFKALESVSEIRRITGYRQGGKFNNGRLHFLNNDDQPIAGNNKAQFLLIFDPYKIGARVTSYVEKRELMK